MQRLRTLAAVAGIALIAACGSNGSDDTTAVPEGDGSASETGDDNAESGPALIGSRWVLQEAQTAELSAAPDKGTTAWLRVDESGKVKGSTGCNSFGGNAEVGDGSITFQPLLATKKGCSGSVGVLDSEMLGFLQGDVGVEVSGDSLTLTNAKDETLTFTVGQPPSTDM